MRSLLLIVALFQTSIAYCENATIMPKYHSEGFLKDGNKIIIGFDSTVQKKTINSYDFESLNIDLIVSNCIRSTMANYTTPQLTKHILKFRKDLNTNCNQTLKKYNYEATIDKIVLIGLKYP